MSKVPPPLIDYKSGNAIDPIELKEAKGAFCG
jgi:hypothetical protein